MCIRDRASAVNGNKYVDAVREAVKDEDAQILVVAAKIELSLIHILYMMTPDKDYGQLVSEHIFMYRPKFGGDYEIMGVPEVLNKYGLTSTEQVIDLLGLMGDASDNIPGCPGVGEKTAQKLLTEFGSIENLLANTDKLKGAQKKTVSYTHLTIIRFQ